MGRIALLWQIVTMRNPAELLSDFRRRLHVIDGALATELESRGHDISGNVWSAQVLMDDPAAIEQLHYEYLKSGADIVITATFQATFAGLAEAGVGAEDAASLMRLAVELAVTARDRYQSEGGSGAPLVAASIGPYGAYLHDGSEYSGDYDLDREQLIEFHRERFELLAESPADLIAFETLPSLNEARALLSLLETRPEVPAWFSFTCWDDARTCHADTIESCAELLGAHDQVVAIGVNCTPPRLMEVLIARLNSVTDKPIIAYPNSGEIWDGEARCWTGETFSGDFAEMARTWRRAGACLIGGCCRTGPEHIARLREALTRP